MDDRVDTDQGLDHTTSSRKSGGTSSLRSFSLPRRFATSALLTPPLAWFLLLYLSSLALMLITSMWSVNGFTGLVQHLPEIQWHQLEIG